MIPAHKRKRLAIAIADEIMRGFKGQASEVQLIVGGKKDGVWERDQLVARIMDTINKETLKAADSHTAGK